LPNSSMRRLPTLTAIWSPSAVIVNNINCYEVLTKDSENFSRRPNNLSFNGQIEFLLWMPCKNPLVFRHATISSRLAIRLAALPSGNYTVPAVLQDEVID
jgi:hypothetical protein